MSPAALGAVDTTGALRLTSTFNHTDLLLGAGRRLGDILGDTFRRLWRKHARVALTPVWFIFTYQSRRAKVRSAYALRAVPGDKRSAAQRRGALRIKVIFFGAFRSGGGGF